MYALKRLDKCCGVGQQIVTKYRPGLGADHPETLRRQAQIDSVYRQTKQFNKCVAIFQELTKEGASAPRNWQDTTWRMLELGKALQGLKCYSEALPYVEKVVAMELEKDGVMHPHLHFAYRDLGVCYVEAGQPDAAIKLYEEFIEKRQLASKDGCVDSIAMEVRGWIECINASVGLLEGNVEL